MALVNPVYLLRKAQQEGYAVAAFNVHNLETVQAVVEVAYLERSPVIIQTTPGTLRHTSIPLIASIVKTASEMYDIPMALHLDHCESFPTIVQCLRSGYTSIMVDGSNLPYEENIALVKKTVEVSHYVGAAVEGELGRIGGTEDDTTIDEREAAFTVPSEALDFVERTEIDSLAVAIGTAHGLYKGEPKLDFERLSSIRKIVDIPLVLHGASGVPEKSIKEAIKRGISKINIATELKVPMARAIKETFNRRPEEIDPRNYMGAAREAVKKAVGEVIHICNCNGKA